MSARPRGRRAGPPRVLLLEMAQDGTVGGSHQCLRNIALALRDRGYCPVAGFLEDSTFVSDLRAAGIESHVFLPASKVPPSSQLSERWRSLPVRALRSLAGSIRTGFRARKLLRELNIDLLHQNNSVGYGEDWFFAARSMRIPLVVHQRGFFFGTSANRWLTDWSIHRAICISRAVEHELLGATRIPPSRVVQIWDFVDTNTFSPLPPVERAAARAAIGEATDRFLIGMIGNIKEWKGQHVVLQALSKLRPEAKQRVRCLFFGSVSNRSEDQNYFERLRDMVREAGLGSIVDFRGFRDEMRRLYPALDLLVHASIDPEPFGMVLAEAMACGVPVIASRGGGPDEIVQENETGWLVDRGDADGLAARLESVIDKPEALPLIGEKARGRAIRYFSPDVAMGRLIEVYSELVKPVAS